MTLLRCSVRDTLVVLFVCLAVVRLGQADELYLLGSADTMSKVFRDEPQAFSPVATLSVAAAKNEVEGIQLVVAPQGTEDLHGVTLEVSDLVSDGGASLAGTHVTWNPVGYVETDKPNYPAVKVGWWPDPLLPAAAFDVPAGQWQPVWINVHVPADTPAGLYRGPITVRPANAPHQSVMLEVRVWDFAVPATQHVETCFPLYVEPLRKFYQLPQVPLEMYEEWTDFCMEYRICALLSGWPEFDRDLERLAERQLDRGGASFCLGGAGFQQGEPEERRRHNEAVVAGLKTLYDRVKTRGWIDRTYVYCHDEIGQEQYPFALELYSELKTAMPDLRLMQTFYKDNPIPDLDDVLDVWAPNTGRYKLDEFQAQQAKGDDVWWYVCCGPGPPFANLMIEWPAVDHRLLLWQNWKFQVTGFLYWGLNVWRDNLDVDPRWPASPWKAATWRNDAGEPYNGDGQLIYPGPDGKPLSSVRLENLRDGLEDYEYFWLLRDAVEQLRKADAARHAALLVEADKALAIDDAIVTDLTHFSQDPAAVRGARANLAQLIEQARAALNR